MDVQFICVNVLAFFLNPGRFCQSNNKYYSKSGLCREMAAGIH